MIVTQIIVNTAGIALIALIVWYFWLYRREGVQVAEISGVQEAQIKVKGGYDPDVIVVKQGKPVRLHFTRQESAMCRITSSCGACGASGARGDSCNQSKKDGLSC